MIPGLKLGLKTRIRRRRRLVTPWNYGGWIPFNAGNGQPTTATCHCCPPAGSRPGSPSGSIIVPSGSLTAAGPCCQYTVPTLGFLLTWPATPPTGIVVSGPHQGQPCTQCGYPPPGTYLLAYDPVATNRYYSGPNYICGGPPDCKCCAYTASVPKPPYWSDLDFCGNVGPAINCGLQQGIGNCAGGGNLSFELVCITCIPSSGQIGGTANAGCGMANGGFELILSGGYSSTWTCPVAQWNFASGASNTLGPYSGCHFCDYPYYVQVTHVPA